MVAAGGVLAVAVLLALAAELAGRARRVAVDARPAGGALAAAGRGVAPASQATRVIRGGPVQGCYAMA